MSQHCIGPMFLSLNIYIKSYNLFYTVLFAEPSFHILVVLQCHYLEYYPASEYDRFANSTNPTWDNWFINYWFTVGIMCLYATEPSC